MRYGDSLSGIAWKYNTTYQNIMRLNGLNNFFIYPGQTLRVSGTASSSSNTNSTSSSSNYYYHTPILIIEIYMIGVNVHGMSLIVVLKSVKVLVHIGGMQITGIMQLQEMAIELIIILL